MSWFEEEYVTRQLIDVVQLSADSQEDSSGYQTETETESAVARNSDGGFVMITAKRVRKFGPNAGLPELFFHQRPISEAEYATISPRGTPIDLSRVTETVAIKARKKSAQKELLSTAPRCPVHDRKLKLKNGARGEFWGCPKYPACKITQPLNPQQRQLLTESK
jgi:hypothetical protein